LDDPGELVVLMEWETADDWIKWMDHKDAKELQWQIDSLIGEKTFFELYKPEEF
jgi:heme-degrading monooxygenase HmoA